MSAGGVVEFEELFGRVSNWGRWGQDDVFGTLNTITPEIAASAARLVRSGRTVSASRPVGFRRVTMPTDNVLHLMTKAGADAPDVGEGAATDWVGVGLHGVSFTHIDAFSHLFWNGQMYNGRSKSLVTTERGALAGGIEATFNGIVTRGVLLDLPTLLGVDTLAAHRGISSEELAMCFDRAGVTPRPGDALFVRTGYGETGGKAIDDRPTAGLTAACMPLLREADIAVMVSDGVHDVHPSGYDDVDTPVHVLALVAMGLWLVDNAQLGPLASACREEGRNEFLATLAPIPFRRATGSLVNPIAVF